jgi:two-component system, LuxR family, sensor kinase FixL
LTDDQEESGARNWFSSVFELAPYPIVLINRSGAIIQVNVQTGQTSGYSRTDLLGQQLEILVPEARRIGAEGELYAVRKDGTEFPTQVWVKPIDTAGESLAAVFIVDITDRKALEQTLSEREHRLQSLETIIDSIDDAIVTITLDGLVTSWNSAAERIFGYSATEMIGQSILRLAVAGGEAEMLETLRRVKGGERVNHYETWRRHKDGSVLAISLSEAPLFDIEGRLVGVSKVLHDVTARKRAERALAESETRLRTLHDELLRISRLNEMGQMAAALSHEINQPLTVISSYMIGAKAILNRRGRLPIARLREAVEAAGDQAVRASEIIRNMRDFLARGDVEKRAHPLRPLLEEACALASLATPPGRIDLELSHVLPDTAVMANKIQIQQVLLNLIRNAAEAVAGQGNGCITIGAAVRNEEVEVSVADNGPGLSRDVMDQLFQPFISTKAGGMGMGLSICHAIMADHKGRLWAEENPDGGAIFRLTLERARGAPEDDRGSDTLSHQK